MREVGERVLYVVADGRDRICPETGRTPDPKTLRGTITEFDEDGLATVEIDGYDGVGVVTVYGAPPDRLLTA